MKLTKEEFKQMYYSMTNEEMAKELKMSRVTLGNYAKKLGLKKRESFSNKPKLKIIED